mmetsp:Transcript_138772/g.351753  ORF Transcript_138772/g.351753 Transcript_138772/m.351753 type:complete len:206 (+) Transcript_138772:106-723(+)
MWGSLLSHTDVVAGEDVFAQVHDRRAFAHASPVSGPEAVKEVRVPVVHTGAHATQKALVDGAKGPFGCGMALPNSALTAGVDVLAEAEVAALGRCAILLVQRHEHAQDVWHLEALTDECAHVTIQGLDIVASGEAQAIQLVAGLALRLVVALPEPELEAPWQDLEHTQASDRLVPLALHTGLLHHTATEAALLREEILDHPPQFL